MARKCLVSLLLTHFLLCLRPCVATASNYSLWMSTSIVSRDQGIMTAQGDSSALLQAGITQKAFRRLVDQYPNETESFATYAEKSIDSVVPFIQNATFDTSYPLDRLSNGNNLIALELDHEKSNTTFISAVEALRQSIDLQPRNLAGGLWYYVYPNWSYLDGMYSFAPFAALYAATRNETNIDTALNHIVLQFDLLWDHCHDNSTDLLVHGYDYSKTAVWADPVTGASQYVWGRSLGWYLMALLDTLEILLPYRHSSQWMLIKSRFEKLSTALVEAVDPASGAWWQILNAPGRAGNYIESSGSSMFVYALLKGERLGWLAGVEKVAVRAYEYIADTFVDDFHNGTLGWNGTVAVCSLNSTASFEYYTSQPILYNSVLGSGAFVLASLEYELLL